MGILVDLTPIASAAGSSRKNKKRGEQNDSKQRRIFLHGMDKLIYTSTNVVIIQQKCLNYGKTQ